MLKELAVEVNIKKPMSSHKFARAQATYMVRKGYKESIIRAKLGWIDEAFLTIYFFLSFSFVIIVSNFYI